MHKIDTLYLSPEYPEELRKYNLDIVGYIIDRKTTKVVDVAVITRRSLGEWYRRQQARFPVSDFDYAIAALSVIGIIKGAEVTDVEDHPKDTSTQHSPYDPSKAKTNVN